MAAKKPIRKVRKARETRGGARIQRREVLAKRPRRGGSGVGRYARPVPEPPADQKPRKPRKPSAEMRELMRDWRKAEREAAQKAVDFFETQLVHFEGAAAGKPFLLEPWQERIIRCLFGRLRPDGTRQYRTAFVAIPRKNGKSTLAAGIALYLLLEGEPAAQVVSAAGDRAQARIVFRMAQNMVRTSRELSERIQVFQQHLEADLGRSIYKVLSSDASLQHGLNVHGAVIDELHTQPDRDLWDVLATGTGARRQPLMCAITTAGFDKHSICWEIWEYARRVISGEIQDDSFYAAIFAADIEDDWRSPSTWRKANPCLGVSIQEDFLAQECERAQRSPAYENTFRRLYLNQWTAQENRFIPMARWDQCGEFVDEDSLHGQPCYAGLDLSSSLDVTAWVLVFPRDDGSYVVLTRFWLPDADIHERSKREGVPYEQWERDKYLTLTDGEVIDYESVWNQIEKDAVVFDIREIAFDRWGAGQLSQQLDKSGHTVVPFGQGFNSMSNPTKELLKLVLSRQIAHGGNPVLRWMADCTAVKQDPAGNIKPVKPDRRKASARIDGIVALIMALDRAMRHQAARVSGSGTSVYETRGIVIL